LSRPPSFIRCFLEDQRDAFSLLGFLVFWVAMAIGASGGGDLSVLGSGRNASRQFWELVISAGVFGVCLFVPIWFPQHLPRAWQFGALAILGLTHALAAVFTIRRWRSTGGVD
jgi:hypothetical protein